MDISMRSMLTAGVTAVTAASIVAAPTIAPLPGPQAALTRAVDLSAAVQTLTRQEVSSALAEIGKLTTSVVAPTAPTAAVSTATPLNAVSDAVVNAYNFVMTYADYFALQLVPYALGFFPFSSLVIDQIYAIYPPITDFTDSIVYDLVAPVINDPLNLAVWANGITAVAYSAGASILNVAINEVNVVINYFLGFLPPLPPIPPWPSLAAPATAATAAAAAVVSPKSVEVPTTDVTEDLAPGLAKPLARASKAALAPVDAAVTDVATAVTSAVPDTAETVAAPTKVATDVGLAKPPAKASRTANAPSSVAAAAAVSGVKKALKSVTKAAKAAKPDKSAGSAAGGE